MKRIFKILWNEFVKMQGEKATNATMLRLNRSESQFVNLTCARYPAHATFQISWHPSGWVQEGKDHNFRNKKTYCNKVALSVLLPGLSRNARNHFPDLKRIFPFFTSGGFHSEQIEKLPAESSNIVHWPLSLCFENTWEVLCDNECRGVAERAISRYRLSWRGILKNQEQGNRTVSAVWEDIENVLSGFKILRCQIEVTWGPSLHGLHNFLKSTNNQICVHQVGMVDGSLHR